MYFINQNYDEDTRTFTGEIMNREANNNESKGKNLKWKYKLSFSEDYRSIQRGHKVLQDEDGKEYESVTFGEDEDQLKYKIAYQE